MFRLLFRLAVYAAAIWASAAVVPGVTLDTSNWVGVALVALVFAIVNVLLKPLLVIVGIPFILLSLGLFLLVINATLFGVTAALTDALAVAGFWAALFGSIVVSAVVWFFELFLGEEEEE